MFPDRFPVQIILTSALVYPSLLSASEVMEEVVVTADFRQKSELDTATSVSVLSTAEVNHYAATHFEDLTDQIPNLNFAGGTSRGRFYQIRGIGERSQFASPVNPSVGVIIDQVDFSGAAAAATLLDVEQVEVLKGPQGTRYGANALAGLIHIKTREPGAEPSLSVKAGLAEYNQRTFSLAGDLPLSETLYSRWAVQSHRSDGYYENTFLQIDDNNARDELTAQGKLLLQASDDWTLKGNVLYTDIDNGYDVFTLDNSRQTLSDEPGQDSLESVALSLHSEWQSDAATLEFIAATANTDMIYSYDEDWTYTGIHADGYSSFDEYARDRDMNSFEIRALSTDSSMLFSDSTDWLVGIYRLNQDETLKRTYTFLAGPYTSQYDFTSTAVFAQTDTALNNLWTLGIGARWERRNTDYADSDGVSFAPGESLWGGTLTLERALENGIWYVNVSRGYKAGGFNTDGSLDADLREFDSEYLVELETGIKGRWWDDRLTAKAALFHDKRKDQQVKSSIVRQRGDGSTEFIDFLGNAAKGTNTGIELETRWTLTSQMSLTGNVGWLRARFDEFINEFGEDLSGRDQAQAPSYTYSLSLDWQQNHWAAGIQFNGKDDFYFSDRHSLKSTDYNHINARVSYQTKSVEISLWGRNLTDDDNTIRGFGSFGNDPRKGYITEPYVQFGEPRVVGMTVSFNVL